MNSPIFQIFLAGVFVGVILKHALAYAKGLLSLLITLFALFFLLVLAEQGLDGLSLTVQHLLQQFYANKFFVLGIIIGLILPTPLRKFS